MDENSEPQTSNSVCLVLSCFGGFCVTSLHRVLTSTSSNTSTMNRTTNCEPEPHISVGPEVKANPCSRFSVRWKQEQTMQHIHGSKVSTHFWPLIEAQG